MKVKTQEVKKGILKSIKQKAKLDSEDKNESQIKPFDDDDVEDEDELDLNSDEELQLAFKRKLLKPGLNVQMDKPKEYVNDEEGLKRKLKDFYLDMDWAERMDITTSISTSNGANQTDDKAKENLVDDDFKRESIFFRQAQEAIKIALPKLKELNIPTKRPEDYFAEMAKSDEHMKKVRETLLSKHADLEKREKIRKLREMKKMGKQIQIEAEKKKQLAKKQLKESIKKFKKGDKDSLNIELEDIPSKKPKKRKLPFDTADGLDLGFDNSDKKKSNNNDDNSKKGAKKSNNKKQTYKEKKYGFGGRKKRSKYNTADSYAEAFNPKKPKKNFNNNSKKTNKKFRNFNKKK